MSKTLHFLLVFLISSIFPASAAAPPPTDPWSYYYFDGTAFKAGYPAGGGTYIAVGKNLRPVVLTSHLAGIDKAEIEKTGIPDGAGVIAGICYLQISGGKLASADGFKPYPLLPIPVSSEGKELVTVQTDQNGYFMAVLPTGTYSVGNAPFSVKITVERGITTLVPLRIGKRMVD